MDREKRITIRDMVSVRNDIVLTFHNFLIEYGKQEVNEATSLEEMWSAIRKFEQKAGAFGILLSQIDLFFGDDAEAEELVRKAKEGMAAENEGGTAYPIGNPPLFGGLRKFNFERKYHESIEKSYS